MSTRATYQFIGETKPSLTLYIHHDGYPKGAAQYVQNWIGEDLENLSRLTVEKFIRANKKSEIIQSHESHADTEYRYSFIEMDAGWNVLVEKRDVVVDVFEGIWAGTIPQFLNTYNPPLYSKEFLLGKM